MMEVKVNLPEVREFIKGIASSPGKLFDFILHDVKNSVQEYLNRCGLALTEGIDLPARWQAGRWRNRDLSNEAIKYLFLDGVHLSGPWRSSPC